MRKAITLLICSVTGLTSLNADVADDKAKAALIGSGLVIDTPGGAAAELRIVEQICNFDTNRIGGLVYELSQTNNTIIASRQLRLLGVYGSASHLPYLYNQLTNVALSASAMESIFRIEGVTSNSVVGLEHCLSLGAADWWWQLEVCKVAVARLKEQQPSAAISNQFSSCLLNSAKANAKVAVKYDAFLQKFDPTYKNSMRRLNVLRAVRSLELNEYQINYVTNAINELVAYPEANLPE